jgi:hypothetical protein
VHGCSRSWPKWESTPVLPRSSPCTTSSRAEAGGTARRSGRLGRGNRP